MRFSKYHGTGNDFILIDNRSGSIALNAAQIEKLCHRRFGIGADGLILLQKHPQLDFEMKYFNADGKPGSLCGNGSRCIIRFAHECGIQKKHYHFWASDGEHQAELLPDQQVRLQMNDVDEIQRLENDFFVQTGSPHLVQFVTDLNQVNVYEEGQKIRYNKRFAPGGTNVNFAARTEDPNRIAVRTYERGVEDETYSCGTGVTACALALAHTVKTVRETCIETKGGSLMVTYETKDFESFENIYLIGPAQKIFEGEINI